ncbi:MAG: helix-turn-helix domain-containing protein [Verrucomicrobiota bacterium]
MNTNSSNERLMRILQATPEQLTAIDRVLAGTPEPAQPERRGPLLMRVCEAAQLLGVHRATIRRLMLAGRLKPVALLGAVRVRREDVEGIANVEATNA